MDHRIVCKPLERDRRKLPDHPRIQRIMQEQVGEDWGDRTALRHALDPLNQRPVGPLHRGLQPALHVHHDPFLVAVARDRPQHQIPRDGIKKGPDVKIDNPVLPKTPLPADRHRVHRRASGTVAVGVLVKHRLHTGLQRHHRRLLRDPVYDIRNAEHPGPTLLALLGISTARTGPGKYDPDDIRFHSR